MVIFVELLALGITFVILSITGFYAFSLTKISKEKLIAFIVSEKKFLKEIKMLLFSMFFLSISFLIQTLYVLFTGDIYCSNPKTNIFILFYIPFILISNILICIPIVKWSKRMKVYE